MKTLAPVAPTRRILRRSDDSSMLELRPMVLAIGTKSSRARTLDPMGELAPATA